MVFFVFFLCYNATVVFVLNCSKTFLMLVSLYVNVVFAESAFPVIDFVLYWFSLVEGIMHVYTYNC